MKKTAHESSPREMRSEYDFTAVVRGKYAQRFAKGRNLVKLDPDVAAVFGDSAAVNRALRAAIQRRP